MSGSTSSLLRFLFLSILEYTPHKLRTPFHNNYDYVVNNRISYRPQTLSCYIVQESIISINIKTDYILLWAVSESIIQHTFKNNQNVSISLVRLIIKVVLLNVLTLT